MVSVLKEVKVLSGLYSQDVNKKFNEGRPNCSSYPEAIIMNQH
jgi:hypothetical protein